MLVLLTSAHALPTPSVDLPALRVVENFLHQAELDRVLSLAAHATWKPCPLQEDNAFKQCAKLPLLPQDSLLGGMVRRLRSVWAPQLDTSAVTALPISRCLPGKPVDTMHRDGLAERGGHERPAFNTVIYLSSAPPQLAPAEAGATAFPNRNASIAPRAGTLLGFAAHEIHGVTALAPGAPPRLALHLPIVVGDGAAGHGTLGGEAKEAPTAVLGEHTWFEVLDSRSRDSPMCTLFTTDRRFRRLLFASSKLPCRSRRLSVCPGAS